MAVLMAVEGGEDESASPPRRPAAHLARRAVAYAIPLGIAVAAAVAQFWDVVVAPDAPSAGVACLGIAAVVTILHAIDVIVILESDDPAIVLRDQSPMLVAFIAVEVLAWSGAWWAITINPHPDRIVLGGAVGLGAAVAGTALLEAHLFHRSWAEGMGRGWAVTAVLVLVVLAIAAGPCFASEQRVSLVKNGTKEQAAPDGGTEQTDGAGRPDPHPHRRRCSKSAGDGMADDATRLNAATAAPGRYAGPYGCPSTPDAALGGSVTQPFDREGAVLVADQFGGGVAEGPMKEVFDELPGPGLARDTLLSTLTNRMGGCRGSAAQFQAAVDPHGLVLLLASRPYTNRDDGAPAEAYLTASGLLPDLADHLDDGLLLVAVGPMRWNGSQVSQPFQNSQDREAPEVILHGTVGLTLADADLAAASFTVERLYTACHPGSSVPDYYVFE